MKGPISLNENFSIALPQCTKHYQLYNSALLFQQHNYDRKMCKTPRSALVCASVAEARTIAKCAYPPGKHHNASM